MLQLYLAWSLIALGEHYDFKNDVLFFFVETKRNINDFLDYHKAVRGLHTSKWRHRLKNLSSTLPETLANFDIYLLNIVYV